MASDSVPAGTKRGGDVSGCRSLNPEPPHPSDHSLLTFRSLAGACRDYAPYCLFIPTECVCVWCLPTIPVTCASARSTSYLKHGLPLGRDSHHPQSHCPHHLFSRRREQERPRSSLPPLSSSTLAHPQLESVLKRTIQIVEPNYVGPRAPSIGFLLHMEGGRVASKGQLRSFTTEAVMVWWIFGLRVGKMGQTRGVEKALRHSAGMCFVYLPQAF